MRTTSALVALVVWSTSCSTPPTNRDLTGVVASCFGQPPQNWISALDARAVAVPEGIRFGLGAVSGELAFGQFNSTTADGIGELDLVSGKLTPISSYAPGVSGLGAMTVELPWVVWEQLDSQTNSSDWSVHAWNEASGVTKVLATSSQGNGTYLPGQQPLPVISHGTVAWAQPVSTSSGSAVAQIHAVDLSTAHVSTLDSGQVSSPVYAGPYLLWGKYTDGSFSLRAVAAESLEPLTLPDQLRHPGSIGYLAGSPRYLVWGNRDYTVLTSWQVGTNSVRKFSSPDNQHHFQFLQLAGHFVLWFGGVTSSVLDLTTGKAFDVQGTVTGSLDRIAVSEALIQPSSKGQFTASRVSSIATAAAPDIEGCVPPGS